MKRSILTLASVFLVAFSSNAQKVEFEEYDLNNGMHVILHQDNAAPVVTTSVMYHVGAKDEQPDRTGMAHFFEHLLFEGTKNIKKGAKFIFTENHSGNIDTLRPNNGLNIKYLDFVVNSSSASKNLKSGTPLKIEDLN